ncbi:CHASE3 domain-containing protein [Gemmata sp.]|uniref:CHASE3 domain-containing protein n=1 Tax=Gemmata sp. TaxID=1914242 RepID=UPI003F6F0F73
MPSAAVPHPAFHRLLVRAAAVPAAAVSVLTLVFLGQIVFLLSAARSVEHSNAVIAGANRLLRLFVDGETGVRGYLITGDAAFLEPYHQQDRDDDPAFQELTDLVAEHPAQVARLDALRRNHAEWRAFAHEKLDLRRTGGDYEAPVRRGDGKRRMDAMRQQIADFIRVEEDLRDRRTAAARRATWLVVGVTLGAAAALGGWLAVSTRRQLTRLAGVYEGALGRVEEQARAAEQAARRLGTLHQLDREILAAASVADLSRAAARGVAGALPEGAACAIAFNDGSPRVVSSDGRGERVAAVEDGLTGLAPTCSAADGPAAEERLRRMGYAACAAAPVASGGTCLGLLVVVAPAGCPLAPAHHQIAEEVARQVAIGMEQAAMRDRILRHAAELEDRVRERTRDLQAALDSVRQLQGLLPICAWCKKVRDDMDYWHDVEHYVSAHTEARFSHGICPTCFQVQANGAE